MAKWKYRTSIIDLDEIIPPERLEGVTAGDYVTHKEGSPLDELQRILDEEGDKEWELIQCRSHGSKLLCIWKRQIKETFVS